MYRGKVRFAKEVKHPGYKPRRIVSRAAKATLSKAHDIVEEELRVFVQRVGGGQ